LRSDDSVANVQHTPPAPASPNRFDPLSDDLSDAGSIDDQDMIDAVEDSISELGDNANDGDLYAHR
jgi:hypothetical protein